MIVNNKIDVEEIGKKLGCVTKIEEKNVFLNKKVVVTPPTMTSWINLELVMEDNVATLCMTMSIRINIKERLV